MFATAHPCAQVASVSPVFLATLIRTAREKGIDPKADWALRYAVIGGQSVSRAFRDEHWPDRR